MERTLNEITESILTQKLDEEKNKIGIGGDLLEAKNRVKKEGTTWTRYCEQEVHYSKQHADKLIRVYENFKDRKELWLLGTDKLDILLQIKDSEKRENFIQETKELSSLSTTKLRKVVKEMECQHSNEEIEEKPKKKKREELEAELENLKQENEELKEENEELRQTSQTTSPQAEVEIKVGTYILWKELEQQATAVSSKDNFYIDNLYRLAYFEDSGIVYIYNYEQQKIENSFQFINYFDEEELEDYFYNTIGIGTQFLVEGYRSILESLGISTIPLRERIKKEFEEIGYKAMCKKYHPDISKDPNAEEIFKIVQEMR